MYYVDEGGAERPVKTAQDWARRREQILAGMQEAMGPLPERPKLPPLDVKVTEEKKAGGYTRLTLSFVAEGKDRVPADLYLPASAPNGARRPAIVALHQTSVQGRRDLGGGAKNPNMGYAPELARRGYVVLCPDYPSFGDYKYDFAADDYVSGSMKGVFNHMRCVDLLRARDDVDGERIGVIGHSLGGHNALFLAAFDERVKAAVTSCGWTPFGDYYGGKIAGWTSDRYMPRLRDVYGLDPKKVPFDFYEVIAAIAPRAVFSSSPLRDDNFAVAGVKKAVAAAQPVFELLGAPDRLRVIYPDIAHDFPPDVRRQAYAFLDDALGNKPPGEKVHDKGLGNRPPGAGAADYGAELPRIPPKEPAAALDTFQVLPGFRIEQVAAEPLVRDPIAMAFDENGRLFVVEMVDYSEQDKAFLGSIRLLEDTDGDGRFDKSTVYAEKLSWPTAIVCYDGGVFVGAAPDIYYLKDNDGDGKADVRKSVFTGFQRSNVQGLLNSFHWTLDNRIHGATSLSGGTVRRADDPKAPAVELRGRDFSFDPKTLDLRAESGGAQHGLTFDDWGRKFVCSNSDHIQMVMFEDRYLARNPSLAAPSPRVSIAADGPQAKVFRISPVEPWRIVRTRLRVAGIAPGVIEGGGAPAGYFTGATGTTIYRGDAFPPEYRGQAFIGDVGSNIVHRKVLEPDGVGFVAKRVDDGREFVASTDNWFRPAQFANAPDGTLYIADMYREVIEHPHSIPPEIKKHLDLTSGRERGRIYRVVPEGYRQRPPVRLGEMTTAELVATLGHRNGWHRDTAARLIYERADKAAVEPLRRVATESQLPEARVHALYLLAALDDAAVREILPKALEDEHPRVREHAVRLADLRGVKNRAVAEAMAKLADDPDARVRYQLAFAAGSLPAEIRRGLLTKLLVHDGAGKWVRVAVLSAPGDDPGGVLGALLVDKVWLNTDAARSLVPYLAAQAAARDRTGVEVAGVLERLAETAPELAETTLTEIADAAPSAKFRELLDGREKLRAIRDAVVGKARATAGNANAKPAARARAIRTLSLASFQSGRDVLTAALDARAPHEVQLAALTTLDRLGGADADAALVAAWRGLSPRVRTVAAEVMFARPDRARLFLNGVDTGKIPLSDVDPARLKRLEHAEDRQLRMLAQKLLEKKSLGRRDDVVAAYRPALELKGDPARGRSIFRNTCAGCHRLENFGTEVGPNLAAMASRGAEAVLVNVLDPNREVTPQYVDYIVETSDNRTLTGMLASETATSITLRRAENATDTVLRSDVKRMRSGQLSIMPEGLEQQIDVQGMADLIAYVTSAK